MELAIDEKKMFHSMITIITSPIYSDSLSTHAYLLDAFLVLIGMSSFSFKPRIALVSQSFPFYILLCGTLLKNI